MDNAQSKEGWEGVPSWDPPADVSWDIPPTQETQPLSEGQLKARDNWLHVDQVYDMVPFWLRGVAAAEREEQPLKLEDFLEELESEGKAHSAATEWPRRDATWGWGGDGWNNELQGDAGWGEDNRDARDPEGSGRNPAGGQVGVDDSGGWRAVANTGGGDGQRRGRGGFGRRRGRGRGRG